MTSQERQVLDEKAVERTRGAWDQIARGYDRFVTPTHLELSNEALTRAKVAPGDRFLDVAAGSGALALTAARLGARVSAVDLSPAMIGQLRDRAVKEGHDDLETHVMDGHALRFDDDSFDLTGSQFGVMLFPDMPLGLREMVRVTRPGGRVVVVLYGDPARVEFLTFFMQAVRSAIPDFSPPPLDAPGAPFQAADPSVFRKRLHEAGVQDIRIETVTESLRFPSGDSIWDWLLNSNPIPSMLIADASPGQRQQIRDTLDRMVAERRPAEGVAVLENPVHIGIGTKAASDGH